ncbi:MAG: DUF6909 family protein [Anaerolineaceae bacterium]
MRIRRRKCIEEIGEITVPVSSSDEIDLYLRTIFSLLRSSTNWNIRSFEEEHAGMNSSLHPARDNVPELSALIYNLLLLPACIMQVEFEQLTK